MVLVGGSSTRSRPNFFFTLFTEGASSACLRLGLLAVLPVPVQATARDLARQKRIMEEQQASADAAKAAYEKAKAAGAEDSGLFFN